MLKQFEVIEYFTDENNNITGHQLWPKKKRSDLIDNPDPPDSDYKDQYGNCKYKFENGKIVENITPPTESQIELRNFRKTDLLNIIRILLKGIQDNSDKDFLDFVAKIGKINE